MLTELDVGGQPHASFFLTQRNKTTPKVEKSVLFFCPNTRKKWLLFLAFLRGWVRDVTLLVSEAILGWRPIANTRAFECASCMMGHEKRLWIVETWLRSNAF
jgi:hypothetical protein